MHSLKNSLPFVFLCFLCFGCNNKTVNDNDKNNGVAKDTILQTTAETVTILVTGIPPEPLYENAQAFIEKKYNIKFIYAAGCIVSERLSDSISEYNAAGFDRLNKIHKKDVAGTLYDETVLEFKYLRGLDSVIRSVKIEHAENEHPEIYYSKAKNVYTANYVQPLAGKTQKYMVRYIVMYDSLTKKIITTEKKGTLINNLEDLNK